jgi:C4-type Zn-finger protein
MQCPNCGRRLVSYRTDRQSVRERDVILRWAICVHCRHVALETWSFAESTPERESTTKRQTVTERKTAPERSEATKR